MSLFKRGETWWIDITVPGKERVRRSAGTNDRKQAREYHDTLKVRYITPDEFARLVNELPDHLKQVVVFAVATGLRMRNITELEWREVDLARKLATVDPKNGVLLTVPLNEVAIRVLEQQVGKNETRVFLDHKNRPFDNANTAAFKKALKRAGIDDFRFHDLRHTWASWMIQNGVDEYQLQQLGGWLDPKMVRKYAHLSDSQLGKSAGVIDVVVPHMAQMRHSREVDVVTCTVTH
jgi:integrase